MVGAVVTLAVNVVLNTLLKVQSTVMAVAENVTATGVVCAFPVTVVRAIVGFVAKTTLPLPVEVVTPVPPEATGKAAPSVREAK